MVFGACVDGGGGAVLAGADVVAGACVVAGPRPVVVDGTARGPGGGRRARAGVGAGVALSLEGVARPEVPPQLVRYFPPQRSVGSGGKSAGGVFTRTADMNLRQISDGKVAPWMLAGIIELWRLPIHTAAVKPGT